MTTDPRIVGAAWVAIAACAAIGVGVVLSDTPAHDATVGVQRPIAQAGTPVRQTEYSPAVPDQVAGNGTYVVGKQIKAATYRTAGGPRCTWVRLATLTGDPRGVLDRGTAPASSSIDLAAGVVGFVTNGCPEWVMVR